MLAWRSLSRNLSKVGRDRRARRNWDGRPGGPALPGSWLRCANRETWRLSMNRSCCRQVVDCASPLALFKRARHPTAAEDCRNPKRGRADPNAVWFMGSMRIPSWRSRLSLSLVAADVSPLDCLGRRIRADSRRRRRFRVPRHGWATVGTFQAGDDPVSHRSLALCFTVTIPLRRGARPSRLPPSASRRWLQTAWPSHPMVGCCVRLAGRRDADQCTRDARAPQSRLGGYG